MTLTITADDPFKALNRLNTVPITVVENICKPLPTKEIFTLWKYEKEECFYDERTITLIKKTNFNIFLLVGVILASVCSLPILFRKEIAFHRALSFLALECFGTIFLLRRIGYIVEQSNKSFQSHLESLKNELATLRKKGLEVLSTQIPASSEIEELKKMQIIFDSRKELMLQSVSSQKQLRTNPCFRTLCAFAAQVHDDLTAMQSLILSLYNQENQGGEEKEIVTVLQQLFKEDGAALEQKITDLFTKIRDQIAGKFKYALNSDLPLEQLKIENDHLLKNLGSIDQLIRLLKNTFLPEDVTLPIFSDLSSPITHLQNNITTMQSLTLSLYNQEDQGEEEKEIVTVLQLLFKEDGAALERKIPDLFNKIEKKIEVKFKAAIKQGLPFEPLKQEFVHLKQNLNTIDQLILLLKNTFEAKNVILPNFTSLKSTLEQLSSFDPLSDIPDDIQDFAQMLIDLCEDKTLTFELEDWRDGIERYEFNQPSSRTDKLKALGFSTLQKPEELTYITFWHQTLPELFIALKLSLKRKPEHFLTGDIHVLLNDLKELKITPGYFCTHAQKMLEIIDLFTESEMFNFRCYYRLFILKEKCGFYTDKCSGLA